MKNDLMGVTGRKHLPHDVPLGVGSDGQVFFITVCAAERDSQPLIQAGTPEILMESVRHRHNEGLWFARVFIVMPDHVHLLIRMSDTAVLCHSITQWKRWTARQGGFVWQRDFFDHRLRSDESSREKADYILNNPVRAGLCDKPEDWPHRWVADWDYVRLSPRAKRFENGGREASPRRPSHEGSPCKTKGRALSRGPAFWVLIVRRSPDYARERRRILIKAKAVPRPMRATVVGSGMTPTVTLSTRFVPVVAPGADSAVIRKKTDESANRPGNVVSGNKKE